MGRPCGHAFSRGSRPAGTAAGAVHTTHDTMTTLSSKIYRLLFDEIIDGTLEPGQKLEEIALAERFNASRTPIREALRELAARGMVELTPRKGVVVAQFSLDELADMLEAMCELEALCCRLSAQRMSVVEKKQLEELQVEMNEAIARGDEAEYFQLNREFHELICKGAQSKSLASIIAVQRQRLAGFRAAQPASPKRFEAATDEHREIVDAILAAEPERAYNAMRDHTARLSIVVLGRLKRQRNERESI
ncbi:transcriptional regulator, GntR family [Burkholderia lata]|uniref:Transcriptional regulator, GntR family n=2 Tax=Burkholderia lata (strain ATCC 17760 / DSM 23089 / LMG 22485 / NCIMB 9086 / R18194 / 383) TaxID=482957 RepID=Q39LG8_BURL3|nr:transcriptional regulator, GntR family [Burkholderia lata]